MKFLLILKKTNPIKVWIAYCRRKHYVVAFKIGDDKPIHALDLLEVEPMKRAG